MVGLEIPAWASLPWALLTLWGPGDILHRLFPLAACSELDVRMAGSSVWAPWCVESLLFVFFFQFVNLVLPLALCFTTWSEAWHFCASHANKCSDPSNEQR